MSEHNKHIYLKNLIALTLFLSAVISIASGPMPKGNLQSLMWGLQSFFMILGGALLGSKLTREDHDIPAAGFNILVIAFAMLYGFLATHDAGNDQFSAGIIIFVPGLLLISGYHLSPWYIRILGLISAIAFGILSFMIFMKCDLTHLYDLLTTLAYLPLNIVILAWAWMVYRQKV